MERVKDAHVIGLIEQISGHYQSNIANRFLRPHLVQLQIEKSTWDQIELLTEKMEMYRYQGFHLDDLYKQIIACAKFVEAARLGLLPVLRGRVSSIPAGPDKILHEIAANNFPSNLQLFSDLLYELFVNLVEIDKKSSGNKPTVFSKTPDLKDVGRMLIGH